MNEQRIQKILKGAGWPAMILAAIVSLASIAYAAYAVGHLFIVYVQIEPVIGALAVLSSVGMAVGLLLVVITTDNQNARGLGAILMLAWVLMALAMVGLDSFMRTGLFKDSMPDALKSIGKIMSALLPALSLAGIICMAIALHDTTPHKSAAGASARYVGFAAKGVGVGASTFASYYFGVSRGIDPILAVLCGALLESSFLWSYLALKNARDRGDRFDVGMWSFCTLLFGLFIAAVSVETLSSLGHIQVPIVNALGQVGATLYVSAVGLTILLTIVVHLLTQAIDDVPNKAVASTPFAIRTANKITQTRLGAMAIGKALKGETPATATPQLPAGMTLADEGVLNSDGWVYIPSMNGKVADFQKQFPNNVKARIHSRTDGVIATWVAWDDRSHAIFDQGSAEGVDGCKRDAEKAAIAYVPPSPLPPERRAKVLNEVLKENDRMAGNIKVSPAGVPYSETQEPKDADAKGWPVSNKREAWEHKSEWMPVNSVQARELGEDGWELVGVGDRELHQTGYMQPSRLHTFRRPK